MFFLYFSILLIWTANVNGKIISNDFDKLLTSVVKEFVKQSCTKHQSKSPHNSFYPSEKHSETEKAADKKDDEKHWDHENQDKWAELFPQCGGHLQSPINIVPREAEIIKTIDCLNFLNYNSYFGDVDLKNNGHSLQASSASWATTPPIISGGVLGKKLYKLDAIHWHWGEGDGHGSEHTINGKGYNLEMHLVHYDAMYKNVSEAVESGSNDALAVVGNLYRLGDKSDKGITAITDAAKINPNYRHTINLTLDELVNPFKYGYFSYYGSLTTPTCNQVVRWIVSGDNHEIAVDQLNVFHALKKEDGKPLVNNFRFVQETNKRQIVHVYGCSNV